MRKHRRKLRRIGNQFKPYNDIFGCDLRPDAEVEEFDGTLFRFPLRTRSQASRSEICDKHYDGHGDEGFTEDVSGECGVTTPLHTERV